MAVVLRRLQRYYRIQFDLLRGWEQGPWALVRHGVAALLVASVSFGVTVLFIPGIEVSTWASVVLAVVVLAFLNILLRPVVLALTVPFGIVAVALTGTLLQFALLLAAGWLVPGLRVEGPVAAVLGAIVFAICNTLLAWLTAFGEDESYYDHLVRAIILEGSPPGHARDPGMLVIQIDGLAHPLLLEQVQAGRVPTISRWMRSGSHHLEAWECQLPSQTSASQAGILLGANEGIPAFRWYEKASGRLLVSNRPADAAEMERRLSTGRGLLAPDGASIGNLLSGDAREAILTTSRMADPVAGLGPSRSWFYFFLSPFAAARVIVLTLGEAGKEMWQARRQRVAQVEPRISRGGRYPIIRGITNVLMRQVLVVLLVERILRGVPVVYADFVDYDEIAHHSGPQRGDALDALDGIDHVLGVLEHVIAMAPRAYRIVVLSDHGQSLGATFKQRYDRSLEDVIRSLISPDQPVLAATSTSEDWGPVNALLNEMSHGHGRVSRSLRWLLRGHRHGAHIELGPGRLEGSTPSVARPPAPGLVVCASGNLGLVYLTDIHERLTLERMDIAYPGLVSALAEHEGIGFVMVRSEQLGPVAIGGAGRRLLASGRVEGADPLTPFGPHAAADLLRLDAMPNVADIVLNSRIDSDTMEVAAFEELVGSHGGLGGRQTQPFLLRPSELSPPEHDLLGAPAVHELLVGWLEALGLREPNVAPGVPASPGGTSSPPAWIEDDRTGPESLPRAV
jgi:uncharacterized membrane protein YvlD (DUF360 family)